MPGRPFPSLDVVDIPTSVFSLGSTEGDALFTRMTSLGLTFPINITEPNTNPGLLAPAIYRLAEQTLENRNIAELLLKPSA